MIRYERNPLCIRLNDIQKAIQTEMLYKKPKRAFDALYGCWGGWLVRHGRFKTKATLSGWKKRGYLTVDQAQSFLEYCFDEVHAAHMIKYGNMPIFEQDELSK